MNIKKTLLLALPILGVAVGGLVAFNSKSVSVAEAADYSTPNRSLSVDENGAVSVTFTVSNSDFYDIKGWLLCLFNEKPVYDASTRKLENSKDLHPYYVEACEHYFFASSEQDSGEITIKWNEAAADQKEDWNISEKEGIAEHQLKDYFASKDWHIVIAPRQHYSYWSGEGIGSGDDGYWENCDYYVGQKSALLSGIDGQTYLDLSGYTTWENDNAKFGFYYFDDSVSPTKEAWSSGFATSSGFNHIYQAEYSLDFIPTKMIAVRFNNNADTLRWNSYDGEKYVWNQSANLKFFEFAVAGVSGDDNTWSYEMASVRFSENDKVALDHLKRNDSNNSENFNQGFPLTANQTFDIYFAGTGYSEVSFHDSSLAANFDTTSVSGKIKVLVDGIYALYFNTDTHALYITTTALAKADEWSIAFLGDGCASTKTIWADSKYDYKYNLDSDVQDILKSEPHVSHDTEVSGYVALAIQRYDFLVENFEGFDDFMGRATSQNIVPYSSRNISLDNAVENNSNLIIIVVASITLVSFTTLLVIKKRKSIR